MSSDARKADAHFKIKRGGVVILGGGRNLTDAQLLGVIIEAMNRITGPNGNAELDNFDRIGNRRYQELKKQQNSAGSALGT